MRVGLISDTHGLLRPEVLAFQHLRGIHPPQKQNDTGHAIRIVILSENSSTFERSKLQRSQVL